MIKDITFKNFGHDCMYFNFINNTLENKVTTKALIPDEENIIMLNEKYLKNIIPKMNDIIYLHKILYKIRSVSENDNGTYKIRIDKYKNYTK